MYPHSASVSPFIDNTQSEYNSTAARRLLSNS